MLEHEIHGLFMQAATAAGFEVATIRNGDVIWKGKEPTDAQLKSILLEAKRTKVGQEILRQMSGVGQALVAKYPMPEQQGWPLKLAEAKAVSDGSLPQDAAFQLGIEASITGEKVSDLATATLAASNLTGMIPAITAGLRRKLEAGISAAKSEDELETLQTSADHVRSAIMGAFASGDPETIKAALGGLS